MSDATKNAVTLFGAGTIFGIAIVLLLTGCGPISHYSNAAVPYTITETVHVDGGKAITHQLPNIPTDR
jgi:hypothetical protein